MVEFTTYLIWAGEFLGLSATVSLWAVPIIIVAFIAALTSIIYYYQEIYADLKAAYDYLFKTKEINNELQKDLKIDARGVAKEDQALSNYTSIGKKPLGLDKGAIYELNRQKGEKIFIKESNKITPSYGGQMAIAGSFDSNKFIAELIASNLQRMYLGDLTPVNYGVRQGQNRYIASKEIPGFHNLFEHIGLTEQQHKDKAMKAMMRGKSPAPILTKSNRQTIVNLEDAIAACIMNSNLDYSNPANLGAVGRKGIFKKQYAASLDYGSAFTYKVPDNSGTRIKLHMGIQVALLCFEHSLFLSNKFAAALEKAAAANDQHIRYMLEATIRNLIVDNICTKAELDKFAQERLINVNNADNLIDDLFRHIKQTQIEAREYAYGIRIKIASNAKDVKGLAELLHNIPENLSLDKQIYWMITNEDAQKLQKDYPSTFMQEIESKVERSIRSYINEFIATNPNLPQLELLKNILGHGPVPVAVESQNKNCNSCEKVIDAIKKLLEEYKPTGKDFIDKKILAGNIINSIMLPYFAHALRKDYNQKDNITQMCADFISSYNKGDKKESLVENYTARFVHKVTYLYSINDENLTLENVRLQNSEKLKDLPWVGVQR